MTRYRIVTNGTLWRIQWKVLWWHWLKDYSVSVWDMETYTSSWIVEYQTEQEARERVEAERAKEARLNAREAPFTRAIEV